MDTSYDQQDEQRAERCAFTLLFNASSFTHSVRRSGTADTIQVIASKGDLVTLHAKQAYDHRTWKKFLASRSTPLAPISLSLQTQPLQQEYFAWLLTSSSTRFPLLIGNEQRAWLRRVVEIAIAWLLLEAKAESATVETDPALVDPWISNQMDVHFLRRSLVQACAQLINRAVKNQTSARELIDQLITTLDQGIPTQLSVSRPSALLLEAGGRDQQTTDHAKGDPYNGAPDHQPIV